MLHSMKRSMAAATLLFVLLPGAQAQQSPGTLSPKERAAVEAQLRDARERLEKAARDVGQLSGKLTGPNAYDYLISSHIRRHGAVLGVRIENDPEGGRKDGVAVESVAPEGPADKAGVKEGDIIVALGGKSLKDARPSPGEALIEQMQEMKPGDKVKVDLLRNGRKQTVEVLTQPYLAGAFGTGDADMAAIIGRLTANDGANEPQIQMFRRQIGTNPMAGTHVMPEGNVMFFNHFAGSSMMDMELVNLTPKLGRYFGVDSGLLVVRPPKDSGLKLEEGDVIVDIDGRKPEDSTHAMRILRSYQPGEQVNFGVMRDRKAIKVAVEVPKGGIGLTGPGLQLQRFITPPSPPEPPSPPKLD